MRKIEVILYQFDELSEKAKEKAREWYREGEAQDFGAHGEIFEPAETAAKILGITFRQDVVKLQGGGTRTEPDIRWSGFSSQGDGASFVGSYEYAKGSSKAIRAEFGTDEKLWAIADGLTELQKKHGYKLQATIEQSGHYVHKYSMSVDLYTHTVGKSETFADAEKELLELMRDFAQWIYYGLEEEYTYRMSDEAVDESIIANEYEFTEDGKRA